MPRFATAGCGRTPSASASSIAADRLVFSDPRYNVNALQGAPNVQGEDLVEYDAEGNPKPPSVRQGPDPLDFDWKEYHATGKGERPNPPFPWDFPWKAYLHVD